MTLFGIFRTMNPSPVVDRQSGAIVLVFSAFPTHMNFQDMLMYAGHPLSRVYVMKVRITGRCFDLVATSNFVFL